jgi:mRNA interferase HigB
MRIISLRPLREFMAANPDAEQPLRIWIDEAQRATWLNPAEIKEQYRNASILKGSRVVFNIRGNHYRLITSILYAQQVIYIKFIGTHKEYDAVDANTVELK